MPINNSVPCYECGRNHAQNRPCYKRRRCVRRLAAVIHCHEDESMEDLDEAHCTGVMDNVCPHCQARFWKTENIACCNAGSIYFETDIEICAELVSLMSNSHFMSHIRQYNMAVAMASVGHTNSTMPGICSFILSGKPYHRISSSVHPIPGNDHKFAQIYLLDTADATNYRMQYQHNACDSNILSQLHEVMVATNPWVRQFRFAAANGQDIKWRFDGEDVPDAMVLGAIIAEPGSSKHIQIHNQNADDRPSIISDCHRLYHPLAYPILFPHGQTGWFLGMRSNDGSSISRVQFLKFLMMRRANLTHLQKCGRLTLEFWCDAWASHEAQLMEFHRRPQQQAMYRSGSKSAVVDQMSHADARDIGMPVPTVLPSSVVGSPRFYHTLFLNAMALPRRYGKPDLFITMTANPYWPEISAQIPADSHWQYHPDIVARVFMIKVESLVSDIREKEIFGPVAAIVWRVEWQKRGLPHLHLLVILQTHITTTDQIDAVVSAEIPNPDTHPILHSLVSHFHIHKPCDTCECAGCRQVKADKSCRRNYPKPLTARTRIDGDNYPIYRRRCFHVAEVKDYNNIIRFVTDEWVVPYSPYLLKRYACHINVEVAASILSFKYLFKYVLKPPDSAVAIVDEIAAYLHGRMLSASEAAFRILGLRLHQELPPVICLDIHLPNHERMVFDPTMSVEDMLIHHDADTTLTGWFKLNEQDPGARNFLYADIPEHYWWNKSTKQWRQRRLRSIAVGRTYAVSPRNVELYSLRLLLNMVRGAISWRCLLHFDGFIYPSFQDACRARGLLNDDNSAVSAFMEIVQLSVSAANIRQQFVNFLLHVHIESPVQFFHLFASDMCDGESTRENINNALLHIDSMLREMHSSLSVFGFELVPNNYYPIAEENPDPIDLRSHFEELLAVCSEEQKRAVDSVMSEAMISPSSRQSNVFIIQGGAGTGKTLWVNCVSAALRDSRKVVQCIASSGLAASLIAEGQTAHSALGIPIPTLDSSFCRLDPHHRQHFRNVDVIIWDEMSMINVVTADCVDKSLQDIRNCRLPFGGIIMIFVGDFKQLPPVIRHGRGEFQTLHRCSWWPSATKIVFTKNWRALNNAAFQTFLNDVGTGVIRNVCVPADSQCLDIPDLFARVYGNNITHSDNDNNMMLSFKLEDANYANDFAMDHIPGDANIAIASDVFAESHSMPAEFVSSLSIPGAPAHAISIKIGARYMLIKNYNQKQGLVNGTLCKCVGYGNGIMHVQLIAGSNRGRVHMIPRCTFQVLPEASGLPFAFNRTQFPVQVAYCVTVRDERQI
jgi:hypothetical protein